MNRSARKGNVPKKDISISARKTDVKTGGVASLGAGKRSAPLNRRKKRVGITGTLDEATERNRQKPKGKRIPTWLVRKARRSIKAHF